MYANAGFEASEVFETLKLLDSFNEISDDAKLDIFGIFNLDSVEYEKASLQITPNSNYDNLDDDLMRTHPECSNRIQKLQESDVIYAPSEKRSELDFETLQEFCKDQIIHSYFKFGETDKALIYTLNKLKNGDTTEFNNSMIVQSIYRLVLARKNHRLTTVAKKPNEFQSETANNLSHMLFATRFKYLAANMFELAEEIYPGAIHDEITILAMIKLAHATGHLDARDEYRNELLIYYPKSDFHRDIEFMR